SVLPSPVPRAAVLSRLLPEILLLLSLPFLLPVIGLVMAARLRSRMRALEETMAEQSRALERLSTTVQTLRKEVSDLKAPPRPAAPSVPTTPPVPIKPAEAAPPKPIELPQAPAVAPRVEPPAAGRPLESPPPRVEPPRVLLPPPVPPPPPKPAVRLDWEQLVGVKMFSAVAGIALVLAAVFFLRYSIEHGWLAPPVPVSIGLATLIRLLISPH